MDFKTVENFAQVFIASMVIVYAGFQIIDEPHNLGNWMMLAIGGLIVGYANYSYRRRKDKENKQ